MFLPSHTRIYLATGGTDMRKILRSFSAYKSQTGV